METNAFFDNPRLAQAYIPFQQMGKVYSLDKALYYGTIFPELNMPYEGDNKKKHCCDDYKYRDCKNENDV